VASQFAGKWNAHGNASKTDPHSVGFRPNSKRQQKGFYANNPTRSNLETCRTMFEAQTDSFIILKFLGSNPIETNNPYKWV